MKKILFTISFIFLFALAANAQTVSECPQDKVCLDRAEAEKALRAIDERDALREETRIKTQAIEDLKKEIGNLRVDLAKVTGELIGEKNTTISQRAIIDLLLKSVKKKKIGLINIF